jgi:hypothetical protein
MNYIYYLSSERERERIKLIINTLQKNNLIKKNITLTLKFEPKL